MIAFFIFSIYSREVHGLFLFPLLPLLLFRFRKSSYPRELLKVLELFLDRIVFVDYITIFPHPQFFGFSLELFQVGLLLAQLRLIVSILVNHPILDHLNLIFKLVLVRQRLWPFWLRCGRSDRRSTVLLFINCGIR